MLVLRPLPRSRKEVCLFDFDGTLSLIREGWQGVMIQYMVDKLLDTGTNESPAELGRLVEDFVERLTGKQTIYQTLRLCEEVAARGGRPEDPLDYKREYHARLWRVIKSRIESLRSGSDEPAQWLVPGSREFLESLDERRVSLYLGSGTDEAFVRREAELLGIAAYFNGRIYGAVDRYHTFSKQILINRILKEEKIEPSSFVAFGDGFVEIEETRRVGGVAVGVASNEKTREGIDQWKLRRLTEAGADLIIGDFLEKDRILELLHL
jgi:phosphoglycolate phosphatase